MNLALFNIDGTISDTDTFIYFVLLAVTKQKFRLGKILLFPYIIFKVYAFGDTHEDNDMLALADEHFYQFF